MPFTDSIKLVDVIISDKSYINATPADVVVGKMYIGSTLQLEAGIMPVNEVFSNMTLVAGESHTVAYGKNPVAYTVTAQALSDQTIGTATTEDILDTKIAWVNGEKIIGTMPNIGSESETIVAGTTHTISKGYHDGTGVITARPLEDQTKGTAEEDDILLGKIAWVNGSEVTGTMPDNESVSKTLVAGDSYIIPLGYHSGRGTVIAQDLGSQTQGTATQETILDGETAWVNGKQITGNIIRIPATTKNFTINEEYFIPQGYHSGNGKIVQNIQMVEGQTVASGYNAQTLNVAGCYMTGNIIVAGINALNFQRPNTPVEDSEGNTVLNQDLVVIDNTATIKLSVDNWHDNATLNIYNLIFTDLKDINDEDTNLNCIITIDWNDQADHTYTFGDITITIGLEEDTNAHTFTITGINSGKITINELFSSRQFGDEHDK